MRQAKPQITKVVCALGMAISLLLPMPVQANIVMPQMPLVIQSSSQAEWSQVRGKHFVVFSQDGDQFYAKKTLIEAEKFYQKATSLLGRSVGPSWAGKERCAIRIYRDKSSYVSETGRPDWSNAASSYDAGKLIQVYKNGAKLFTDELPHEITHLIFREFLGNDLKVPLWLEEGLAMRLEEGIRTVVMDQILTKAFSQGALIPLREMMMPSKGVFLSPDPSGGQTQIALFYAQSYGLVNHLLYEFGESRFINLLEELKRGDDFEQALEKEFGPRYSSLEALEKEWQDSLRIYQSA